MIWKVVGAIGWMAPDLRLPLVDSMSARVAESVEDSLLDEEVLHEVSSMELPSRLKAARA